MTLADTYRTVTAVITTVVLEPGTHISRKVVAEVDRREVILDTREHYTGTIYGGKTVNLARICRQLEELGELPPLDSDHEYRVGVKE
jgi:hypothetical protein